MKNFKRLILGVTAVVLLFVLSLNKRIVVATDFTPPEGNFVVSHKKTELIPGVVENEVIYNNSTGTNPVSGFAVEVNMGSNIGIMAATANYNEKGTQTVLGMAKAAENATGRNIIAGINADLNWGGKGTSNGPMIVDGKIINDQSSSFFGIKKDGTAVLGRERLYNEIKDDLQQAVTARMGWLVENGKIVNTSTSLAPRSAVGIRADGSVILMMIEGRAFPRSNGIGLRDLAELMLNMGAVNAVNLDGGGSSTYIAKRPGMGQLEIRSHLSDGRERASISSILVYGEEGDGHFDRASITTEYDAYTPESKVQFNAVGVDNGGGPAKLPTDLVWEVENEDLGAIDQNGIFESSGEEGEVVVNLKDSNGIVVGSHKIEILIPDELEFRANEFSFGFNEENDLGLRILNNKQELKFKDGDIEWEVEIYDEESNDYYLDEENRLGRFENNIFISNESESLIGRINAKLVHNPELTRTIDIVVGQLPKVIFDFEDDEINKLWKTANANNAGTNLEAVSRDSGEPVRFGDKSLRLDFDFRSMTSYPGGSYAALDKGIFDTDIELKIPGTPTAIGMWVYATEEAQGIWLRGGVGTDGTTTWKALNFTNETDGIDWIGWKFVTLDFAGNNPPFTILDNQFIRLMLTSNSFGGDTSKKPYGSIYIDDITVIYGYNPEDTMNPIVDDFNIYQDEENRVDLIEGNKTIDFNKFTIETSFYDYVDEFTSGIDFDNVSILVDGVNYRNHEGFYLSETNGVARLQNVYLDDGIHEIKVVVLDKHGNETSVTRYVSVNTNSQSLIYFELDKYAILDNTYKMVLKTNEINNIDNIDLSFKISNEMRDFEVEFVEGFEGEVEYLNSVNIVNIKVNRIGSVSGEEILTINVPISSSLVEGANIRYSIQRGTYEYNGEKETYNSFSFKPTTLEVKAPLVVNSEVVMIGKIAKIYVFDIEGNPVESAKIYQLVNGKETFIGETNEEGILETGRFMEKVEAFTLIARLGKDVSYEFKGQSLDSTGDIEGTPFAITHNGVVDPHESKNITWLSNAFANNQEALIRFGLENKFDENDSTTYEVVEGTNQMLVFTGSTTITDNYVINVNNVVVKGLESGKKYLFQVGNGDVWSEVRTFKTVNKWGDVNFFVLGDIQSTNYENTLKHSNVVGDDLVDYDFGIQVGDFVDNAGRYDHWYGVLNAISNSTIGDLDIIKLLGNHEYYGDQEGNNAKTIFNTPDKKDYFSMEYGIVYIAVISYDMNRESLTNKLEWMVEDANNSNARWKLLITHQPPYYTNPEGGNELMNELLPKYVEQVKFDFVISGHDHTYGRTRPLLNGELDPNGIIYLIAGAFGEKTYPVSSTEFNFEKIIGNLTHIYLSFEAKADSLELKVFDATTNEFIDGTKKFNNFEKEHDHYYILEGDRLVCYECQYSRPLEGYVGFLKDQDGNIMYHLVNDFHKGIYFWEDSIYYFDEDGKALTGINEVFGLKTEFDKDGKFINGGTGYVHDGGKLYYYKELSKQVSYGMTKINGKYHYMSTSGNGEIKTGLYYISHLGGYHLFDNETGAAEIGVHYYNGLKVETNEKGLVLSGGTGISYQNEYIYYYKNFNIQKTGFTNIEGYTYYFSTTTGEARTGEYFGYMFDEYGRMIKGKFVKDYRGIRYDIGISNNNLYSYVIGFQEIEGDIYYFDEEGYLLTGEFEVDGFKIKTDKDGKIIF